MGPASQQANDTAVARVIARPPFLYLACLLQLDPEWVMWYGFVMLGTHPPENLPPPLFSDPREAFQVASVLGLLGLIVLVLLMVVAGEVRFGWLSWLKARLSEWGSQEAR